MPITRREVLRLLAGSSFFCTAAARPFAPGTGPVQGPDVAFPQGVASADPQADAVMLWTRAVPDSAQRSPVQLVVEVSTEPTFSAVVLSAPVVTDADSDYTLRTYVQGLRPDTRYFYRFRGAGDSFSRTGRTRTAPTASAERSARVAFASCQSYEQGHFGSWARMIAQDKLAGEDEQIDFVLHLGDFIYERCWHRRIDGSEQARKVPPFPDGADTEHNRYAVSLADYRHLYKTYLSDPHLQEARARWPFVCIWDDHEYSNDNYQSYSTYAGEHVLDPQRKQSSNRAWFEFIPSVLTQLEGQPAHDFVQQPLGESPAADNVSAVNSLCIYRKLSWGRYLDIVLTDSRSYRSPPCLPDDFAASLGLPLNTTALVEIADAGRSFGAGNPPAILPYGDHTTPNPNRARDPGTLLGALQREWFLHTLAQSEARWKLWGNALPLVPMRLDLSSLPLAGYEDSLVNIDGWAGYPHELRGLMQALRDNGVAGLISLSGDHHMHGAAAIRPSFSEPEGPVLAVDFAVAGISSSPVFEDLMAAARDSHSGFSSLVFTEQDNATTPVWNMSMLDGVLPAFLYAKTGLRAPSRWLGPSTANPGLRFVDVTANGFGVATFDRDELRVRLVALQDCRPDFRLPPQIRYTATFRLPHWTAGDEPQLQGPIFEGTAPFPFGHNSV